MEYCVGGDLAGYLKRHPVRIAWYLFAHRQYADGARRPSTRMLAPAGLVCKQIEKHVQLNLGTNVVASNFSGSTVSSIAISSRQISCSCIQTACRTSRSPTLDLPSNRRISQSPFRLESARRSTWLLRSLPIRTMTRKWTCGPWGLYFMVLFFFFY